MTDRPFEHDVSLFELCARNNTSSSRFQEEDDGPEEEHNTSMEEACRILWQGHDRHYGHNRMDESKEEQQQRLERFVQTVAFVHEFNSPQEPLLFTNHEQRHEVSLNQFSDWLPSELPSANRDMTTTTTTDAAWDHMWDAIVDPASLVWDDTNDGSRIHNNNNNNGRKLWVDRPVFVRLEEESFIRRFAPNQPQHVPLEETVRLPQTHVTTTTTTTTELQTNPQHDSSDSPWYLLWNPLRGGSLHSFLFHENRKRPQQQAHDKDRPPPEPHDWKSQKDKKRNLVLYKHRGREVPVAVETKHDGHVFMEKKQHALLSKQKLRHGRGQHGGLESQDKQSEYDTNKIGIIPILDDDSGEDGDKFATHLNWNTGDNPDGVNVVHPVIDQGGCGSCWAIAATGTLEASVTRNAGYHTYADRLGTKHGPAEFASFSDEQRRAVRSTARDAEQAALDVAQLSIQELIDCDTNYDEGCTGGNPLLAFYFIHRHGLTSTDEYPYIGAQDKCHAKRVNHPIATVKTWGILTPNHEDNMELVIRYLGPLAVGVNGADPAFLSYRKGIFDSPNCDQRPNHALLIVGYGQDILADGTKVKYWIARNSWGKGWGEEGYVRIKRGSGKVGQKGVCGIAKGPSVALGGALMPSIGLLVNSNNKPFGSQIHSPQVGYNSPTTESSTQFQIQQEHTYCGILGLDHYSTCANVQGMLGFVLIAVGVIILASETLFRTKRHKRNTVIPRVNDTSTETIDLISPTTTTTSNGPSHYGSI